MVRRRQLPFDSQHDDDPVGAVCNELNAECLKRGFKLYENAISLGKSHEKHFGLGGIRFTCRYIVCFYNFTLVFHFDSRFQTL